MTEISGVLTLNPPADNRFGKVGIPVPGAEIRIVDDAGHDVPLGQPGEVIARSPALMKGYLNRADATAETIRDGWLYSGDIGVMDEDGFLEIVDRKKDMILVSGFNVSPNEIEDVISTVPGVVQVGVIGIPDEKSAEVPAAFGAIVREAFTPQAGLGGMAGVLIQGFRRAAFSNEAGVGSASIAHSAATTKYPVREGVVALLEPFIDTIVICTITGLVILSSGVWVEKFENEFQRADMSFVAGTYEESNAEDVESLFAYLTGNDAGATEYSGPVVLNEGVPQNTSDFTLIAARSLAENAVYTLEGVPITGTVQVTDGQLDDPTITVTGESLLHSVPLTTQAYTRGLFGNFGQYIVSVGLMLFAFSTAIAWSYYGDRAMTYLLGPKSVLPYRIVYVLGFFYAALADTTIVWNVSLITIVLMTVPNLVGILLMHKEMKSTVSEYWEKTDHGKHVA